MWKQPTIEDLKASLSDIETQVFGQEAFDEQPLIDQLANSVSHVRGFVRSGRKCRMPDDQTLLPDFLIAPAIDYAAFNLLKRLRLVVNESRTKAYDRACSLFEKVGSGQIVPEDYGEKPSEVNPDTSTPVPVIRKRKRVLGRREEEGI